MYLCNKLYEDRIFPRGQNINNKKNMIKKVLLVTITSVYCCVVAAQSGVVHRLFTMTDNIGYTDSCTLDIKVDKGEVYGMTFKINHKVDGSYILACIEGSNNRYNRYKTVETRIEDFRNLLINTLEKYKEWQVIAKEHKITSYYKEIGTFQNVPLMYLNYFYKNVQYYRTHDWPYICSSKPMFEVDANGNCSVTFNFGKFSFAKNIGYTKSGAFGLETPVMEEKECENVCFKFNSPNELQKLIDAIDIQSAKNELQNRHGNIENVDSLFK